MKHIISITTLLFTLFLIAPTTVDAQKKKGDKDEFTVMVDGLGCPFCAYGLEKKIKKLKGIKKVKIDMEKAMMTFNYPAEKALTLEDVKKQVDAAGYTAVSSKVVRANGEVEEFKLEIAVSDKVVKSRVVKSTIRVAGVCGMCRSRINRTTQAVEGVVSCDWDEDTQLLTVEYDKQLTSTGAIEIAVAAAGHDTQNEKAADDVYDNLPPCCFYERIHN